MAQRGVPLRQIAGYLGDSEQRTIELYARHHPACMAEAQAAFENTRTFRAHNLASAPANRMQALEKAGAAGGYRTYDLSLTKGVLYH